VRAAVDPDPADRKQSTTFTSPPALARADACVHAESTNALRSTPPDAHSLELVHSPAGPRVRECAGEQERVLVQTRVVSARAELVERPEWWLSVIAV